MFKPLSARGPLALLPGGSVQVDKAFSGGWAEIVSTHLRCVLGGGLERFLVGWVQRRMDGCSPQFCSCNSE
jgi:hypothetical protein